MPENAKNPDVGRKYRFHGVASIPDDQSLSASHDQERTRLNGGLGCSLLLWGCLAMTIVALFSALILAFAR